MNNLGKVFIIEYVSFTKDGKLENLNLVGPFKFKEECFKALSDEGIYAYSIKEMDLIKNVEADSKEKETKLKPIKGEVDSNDKPTA